MVVVWSRRWGRECFCKSLRSEGGKLLQNSRGRGPYLLQIDTLRPLREPQPSVLAKYDVQAGGARRTSPSAPRTCTFKGCRKAVHGRGLCMGHYSQRRRNLDLVALGKG